MSAFTVSGAVLLTLPNLIGLAIAPASSNEILDINIPIYYPNNTEKSLMFQAEIVKILDSFTKLTTEITARKEQVIILSRYYKTFIINRKTPSQLGIKSLTA